MRVEKERQKVNNVLTKNKGTRFCIQNLIIFRFNKIAYFFINNLIFKQIFLKIVDPRMYWISLLYESIMFTCGGILANICTVFIVPRENALSDKYPNQLLYEFRNVSFVVFITLVLFNLHFADIFPDPVFRNFHFARTSRVLQSDFENIYVVFAHVLCIIFLSDE